MAFFMLLVRLVSKIEDFLAVVFLAVLSVSVFLGVFYRYVLRNPLIWSDELALICFVWLVFIGAGICARQKAHVGIEMLVERFPGQVARYVRLLTDIVVIIILAMLIYFGIQHALYASGSRTTALGISWTYVFLSIPVGSTLMLIHVLHELITGSSMSLTINGHQPHAGRACQVNL